MQSSRSFKNVSNLKIFQNLKLFKILLSLIVKLYVVFEFLSPHCRLSFARVSLLYYVLYKLFTIMLLVLSLFSLVLLGMWPWFRFFFLRVYCVFFLCGRLYPICSWLQYGIRNETGLRLQTLFTLAHRVYISYNLMSKTSEEKAIRVSNLEMLLLRDHLNQNLDPRNLYYISERVNKLSLYGIYCFW
jgi:hypothetical protein